MLIRAMVGQQITVAAARTALTRLVHELGTTVEAPDGEPHLLFPTMPAIAEHGHEVLRGPAHDYARSPMPRPHSPTAP